MRDSRSDVEPSYLSIVDHGPAPRSEFRIFTKQCGIASIEAMSVIAVFFLVGMAYEGSWNQGNHLRNGISIAFLYILVASYRGSFTDVNSQDAFISAKSAATSLLLAFGLRFVILFILKSGGDYSRFISLTCIIISVACIVSFRIFGSKFYEPQTSDLRIAVVLAGGPPFEHDYKPIFFGSEDLSRILLRDQMGLSQFGERLKDYARVIVSCPIHRRAEWALILQSIGVRGEVVSEPLHVLSPIGLTRYEHFTAIQISSGPLSTRERVIKRIFDLSLTIPLLIFLFPILILLSLIIKLDSEGPVLFEQERLGKGNRRFIAYKFRSMRDEKSDSRGVLSTSRDDDRVTTIGKFIRRTSLDELPQLFNVLRGDMSLVGPRPHALGSTADGKLFWEVSDTYWKRHAAKPGLTGLAQVRGFRGATDHEDDLIKRIRSDLEYLQDWSIWKDLIILIKTVNVLMHPNAY